MDNNLLIEQALEGFMPDENCSEKNLIKAMKYSLKAGGKRVRPNLTLEFCRLCGKPIQTALPFACAIEMIHTYSLIHDDLPCMDNDDFRRGEPSNHKVFGEDIALLAGDALLTLAFETMLGSDTVAPNLKVKAAHCLAKFSGALGMIGGQVIDLENEDKNAEIQVLQEMDEKKTGGLIKAACCMGCIVANADEEKIKAAEIYGENIGIAFQIVDDILDVTSTTESLGKPVGSDNENNKSTYVSLLGVEKCRSLVDEYTKKAIDALSVFNGDIKVLEDFAVLLAKRKN